MIRVGIGGWVFKPWRGEFYPEGLPQARELDYASRKGYDGVVLNISGDHGRGKSRASSPQT